MPKTQSEAVTLSGRVVDWDHKDHDERDIKPEEAEEYERQEYSVVSICGMTLAEKELPFEDGVIQIQPKSDAEGRFAARGGHTNFGYSGYFIGYIYVGGERRRIVNWKAIFPREENRYAAQKNKRYAREAIEKEIRRRAGTVLAKVKGGYAFDVS